MELIKQPNLKVNSDRLPSIPLRCNDSALPILPLSNITKEQENSGERNCKAFLLCSVGHLSTWLVLFYSSGGGAAVAILHLWKIWHRTWSSDHQSLRHLANWELNGKIRGKMRKYLRKERKRESSKEGDMMGSRI